MYMKTYMFMHFWSPKFAKNVLFCTDAHHMKNKSWSSLTFLTIAHITCITHPTAVHALHISVLWHSASTFHQAVCSLFMDFCILTWSFCLYLWIFSTYLSTLVCISSFWTLCCLRCLTPQQLMLCLELSLFDFSSKLWKLIHCALWSAAHLVTFMLCLCDSPACFILCTVRLLCRTSLSFLLLTLCHLCSGCVHALQALYYYYFWLTCFCDFVHVLYILWMLVFDHCLAFKHFEVQSYLWCSPCHYTNLLRIHYILLLSSLLCSLEPHLHLYTLQHSFAMS